MNLLKATRSQLANEIVSLGIMDRPLADQLAKGQRAPMRAIITSHKNVANVAPTKRANGKALFVVDRPNCATRYTGVSDRNMDTVDKLDELLNTYAKNGKIDTVLSYGFARIVKRQLRFAGHKNTHEYKNTKPSMFLSNGVVDSTFRYGTQVNFIVTPTSD